MTTFKERPEAHNHDRAPPARPNLGTAAHVASTATGRLPISAVFQRAATAPRSLTRTDTIQLQRTLGNAAVGRLLAGGAAPANTTGLPDRLKAGVENLSGLSMDDVRVHYNSANPADMQALAYTRGSDIFVAPGQEQHLPHEAWHVVQQKQGRVKPTLQMKGVAINDDDALEHEASSFQRLLSRFTAHDDELTNSAGVSTHGVLGSVAQMVKIGDADYKNLEDVQKTFKDKTASLKTGSETAVAKALSSSQLSYLDINDYLQDIRMRAVIIDTIRRIDRAEGNIEYFVKMMDFPSAHWTAIDTWDSDNERDKAIHGEFHREGGGGFQPRDSGRAAIKNLIESDDKYYLECNSAIVAVHYYALTELLGDEFDQRLPKIQLVPEFSKVREDEDLELEGPRYSDIAPRAEVQPEQESELLPGDWVYFTNIKGYTTIAKKGAYEGENCIYLGDKKYRGLGLGEDLTYDQVCKFLEDEFDKANKRARHPIEKIKENTEAWNDNAPGILKGSVRRMGEGEFAQTIGEKPTEKE